MRQTAPLLLAVVIVLGACQRNAAAPSTAATEPGPSATAAPTTAPPAAKPVADSPAAKRIKADVDSLASDTFEGRETGTRGYDQAADHVATQFRKIGLAPAGDDGTYFQRVPLLQSERRRDGVRLVVHRNGRDIALRFGEQYLPAPGFNSEKTEVQEPAVFVNHGIVAPALHVDDLAGVELKGRIAVLFHGTPDSFNDDQRALYGNDANKLRLLAARGAAGVVFVNSALDEVRIPWATVATAWEKPAMQLRDDNGKPLDAMPGLLAVATVSATAADLLFADQPQSAAELFNSARNGDGKGFVLPGTLTLSAHSAITTLAARNVVARLPGSDPGLAGAPVVTSAHLDHLGIGKAVDDDNVYNGAIDNALGVAILLEAARQQLADGASRRPQLFLASTGGEQGALGARWFATHPPGGHAPIADLDLDMPVLTAPTTDVVAIGGTHSSLQATLDTAAKQLDIVVSPDPYPEDDAFARGDHAAFVRAGIPALYLTGGTIAADKVRKPEIALRYYLRNCYQRPCDDAAQPIRYDDAARLARLNARIARLLGDTAEPPRWNPGDVFGGRFAK